MNTIDSALRDLVAQNPPRVLRPAVQGEIPTAAGEPPAAPRTADAPSVFAADRARGDDLGRAGEAAFLAELALHKRVETPLGIGLFGPPGAGKSVLLGETLASAERLANAAGPDGPFASDVVTVLVDASADTDPGPLLRDAVVAQIAKTHPALAADLRHAGEDPVSVSRRADAALDEARRRLAAEREALDDLTGREARLIETVIETPGSRVDSYARSRRSQLDRVLRQFGFGAMDPVVTYKDLVREAAEANGPAARVGMTLRALWAYKGQTRLIVIAVLLFVGAWLIGVIRGDGTDLPGAIGNLGDRATPVADWAAAHMHWLGPIETGLMLLGMALLLLDIVRAARFVLPLARGVDLLQQDLEGRRRDIAGQLAHQTRRVDALAADVAAAAGAASDAERRLAAATPAAAASGLRGAAQGPIGEVFAALQAAMTSPSPAIPAPGRIVVAIDGLDRLPSDAAARFVAAAGGLLGEGCVWIVAAERAHLVAGFGDTDPARASAQVARAIQVPYRVGAADASDGARRTYAAALISGTRPRSDDPPAAIDASRSALDAPWRPREADTVAALAPFAGNTPRAIKRFVNVYRVARADPRLRDSDAPVFTALALALALDAHGFPDDLSALARASHGESPGESTLLRKAVAAAREASGQPVELGQAQRALDVAESYSSRA